MRIRRELLWIAAVLVVLADAAAARQADGYSTDVLTDAGLDGWDVLGTCGVEMDGRVMHVGSGSGRLRSRQVYSDFRLQLEWQPPDAGGRDDVCVFFAAGPAPDRSPGSGILVGLSGRQLGRPSTARCVGTTACHAFAGRWNTLDLMVVDGRVVTAVNGQPAYEVRGSAIPTGHLGLRVKVAGAGGYRFRNIQVTELGHSSLFNGLNLDGWVASSADGSDCWTVEHGAICCNGARGPWLRSLMEYGDFNLRLEYQIAPDGNSGIYVRVPADGNHHRENDTLPPAGFEVQILDDDAPKHANLKDYQYTASVYDIAGATQRISRPAGEWNKLEINCLGHHVTCLHNGVRVVDAAPDRFPLLKLRKREGFLGLQNHRSVVKFRKLRIGPPVERYPASVD